MFPQTSKGAKTGGYVPCEPKNRGYVPGGKSANRQNRGYVPDRDFANRHEEWVSISLTRATWYNKTYQFWMKFFWHWRLWTSTLFTKLLSFCYQTRILLTSPNHQIYSANHQQPATTKKGEVMRSFIQNELKKHLRSWCRTHHINPG